MAAGVVVALAAAVAIPAVAADKPEPATLPISIDAKDVSISEVLRMLAKASGANIVVGQDVEGYVDAISLHDITVEDALRLIAEANGLYWYKDTSNTYVVTGVPPKNVAQAQPTAGAAQPSPGVPSAPAPSQPTPAGPSAPGTPSVGTKTIAQPSEPSIPVPPLSPGPSSVTTKAPDRQGKVRTEWIRLNYLNPAEVAEMFGGRVVWGSSGGSLELPTPASARRRAFGYTAVSAESNVAGGLASTPWSRGGWRQFRGPGGLGGGFGGRGAYGGGVAGGLGRAGGYGAGYGRGGYGAGGLGARGGYGGYGGAGAMLLPSPMMEIVAYMPQNALLVRGLPEEIDELKEVISWLDQPAKQVEISCKFVSITVTALRSLGIDWRVSNGQLEFWNLGFAPGEAVNNVIRWARGRFEATLSAAVQSGRATVLSEPMVTTQNNMPAEINFYEEIPYPVATITYNEFGQRQVDYTVEYAYINNMLSVTPRIHADDSVTMEVYPEIDQQIGTVEMPTGERIPITSNWYVYVPQVRVADGETLVIGGMISKTEDEQLRRTPLLSEIPLIGNLFKAKRRTINNQETLIFITPHIVREIPTD